MQHYCFAYNKNLKLNTKHYSFTEQMLISQSRNKNLLNAKDCIYLLFFCLMNIEDTLIDQEMLCISTNKWRMLYKRMCRFPFQCSLLTLKVPVELKITCFYFLLQKVYFQLCKFNFIRKFLAEISSWIGHILFTHQAGKYETLQVFIRSIFFSVYNTIVRLLPSMYALSHQDCSLL